MFSTGAELSANEISAAGLGSTFEGFRCAFRSDSLHHVRDRVRVGRSLEERRSHILALEEDRDRDSGETDRLRSELAVHSRETVVLTENLDSLPVESVPRHLNRERLVSLFPCTACIQRTRELDRSRLSTRPPVSE